MIEGAFPTLKIAFVVITMLMPGDKLVVSSKEYKNTTCKQLTPAIVPNLVAMTKAYTPAVAGRGRIIKPAIGMKNWSYTCKEFDPGQNS